jgi:nicotinate dehydrogenase subunit A
MPGKISLHVNGRQRRVAAEPGTPLLYALRNDLGLNGPKFGCGLGQCGACTVLLDGEAVRSCVTAVDNVGDAAIVTLEGLGTPKHPHPLQEAFIAEQAMQCGYCANGMIMTAAALLREKPHAGEADVRLALAGNLCRCGTQLRIVRAVLSAAKARRA